MAALIPSTLSVQELLEKFYAQEKLNFEQNFRGEHMEVIPVHQSDLPCSVRLHMFLKILGKKLAARSTR